MYLTRSHVCKRLLTGTSLRDTFKFSILCATLLRVCEACSDKIAQVLSRGEHTILQSSLTDLASLTCPIVDNKVVRHVVRRFEGVVVDGILILAHRVFGFATFDDVADDFQQPTGTCPFLVRYFTSG